MAAQTPYPAYFRDVSHLTHIDVYRVIDLFDVQHPALQHALKKILAAGKRGAKDDAKDVQEAIDSLARWQQMREEDARVSDLADEATYEAMRASIAVFNKPTRGA